MEGGWHWDACHRSSGRKDGLCISHRNRPPHKILDRHSHDQDTLLVSEEGEVAGAEEEEEGKRTCGLCREARVSPLESEEENSLLSQVEVDTPPPLVPLSVCFLIFERVCVSLETLYYPGPARHPWPRQN